jgi:PhnB protein
MADSKDTYRTVTPYLVVSDADAELAFLKAAFGAVEVNCQRNPDNTVMHAEITIGDSLVMLGQAGGSWTPRTTALYLWVENVDATYARALEAGATSESEPQDKPYGHRNAGLIDRGGVTWWIGAPVREKQTSSGMYA